MKWNFFLLLLIFSMLYSCDYKQREEDIRKKEKELNLKEQHLLQKEKTLSLKEDELLQRERKLDTIANDSLKLIHQPFIGTWLVNMTCSETTCAGSAVGDTKTETWIITFEQEHLIARAQAGNDLIRIYTGLFNGTEVILNETKNDTNAPLTQMTVRLRMVDEKNLEGHREIVRENQCKVVYTLQMKKQ